MLIKNPLAALPAQVQWVWSQPALGRHPFEIWCKDRLQNHHL